MGQACLIQPGPAIAARCNSLHQTLAPDFFSVVEMAKSLWPNKTAENLHLITGASLRACKYWLAGEHAPSGQPLLILLRVVRHELESRQKAIERIELTLSMD